jgi:hypothetical protein
MGGGVNYKIIGVSGKYQKKLSQKYCGGGGRFNFRKFRQDFCNKTSLKVSLQGYDHIMSQVASPEIIKAWRACIRRKSYEMICTAKVISKKLSMLTIEWDHKYASTLRVTSIDTDNLKISKKLRRIYKGKRKLLLRIKDPKKNSIFLLNARDRKGNNHSCEYKIPPYINSVKIFKKILAKSKVKKRSRNNSITANQKKQQRRQANSGSTLQPKNDLQPNNQNQRRGYKHNMPPSGSGRARQRYILRMNGTLFYYTTRRRKRFNMTFFCYKRRGYLQCGRNGRGRRGSWQYRGTYRAGRFLFSFTSSSGRRYFFRGSVRNRFFRIYVRQEGYTHNESYWYGRVQYLKRSTY